jgi:AraC family transcriptional regulator
MTGTTLVNATYLYASRSTKCGVMKSAANIVRKRQIGPFRLIEKSYAPDCALAMHEHKTAYVSFLMAGAYVEVTPQEERFCSSGTVIWHPKTEAHADRFQPSGGHVLDLEIDAAWLDDAAQDLTPVSRARVFCGGLPYSLGLRTYRGLGEDHDRVEDAATELLGFFFAGPPQGNPPAWFNHALQACSDVERRNSLASVALSVGVHPVHLARSFRRFLGCTFGDYLAKFRVRKAFELLLNSNTPIVDVAYACGFADHAHLCRVFKKSTGFTPSAFRCNVHAGRKICGK